jgi:hypothetical protein
MRADSIMQHESEVTLQLEVGRLALIFDDYSTDSSLRASRFSYVDAGKAAAVAEDLPRAMSTNDDR